MSKISFPPDAAVFFQDLSFPRKVPYHLILLFPGRVPLFLKSRLPFHCHPSLPRLQSCMYCVSDPHLPQDRGLFNAGLFPIFLVSVFKAGLVTCKIFAIESPLRPVSFSIIGIFPISISYFQSHPPSFLCFYNKRGCCKRKAERLSLISYPQSENTSPHRGGYHPL